MAAGRPDVISLGIGEPDFVTPWRIREAAIYAVERGHTTYTANSGAPLLREMIAEDCQTREGLDYDPKSEIVVTSGVSEALDIALRAIVEPGDEVLLFEPCYVSYGPCVTMAGGRPVAAPTRADRGFVVDPADAARLITPATKAMLICSPGNPTGAVQPAHVLEALVRLAVEHDLYLISDEIYSRLVYGATHTCVAALDGARERTVLLNGLSKSMAMTGWRVGYACAPLPIAELMLKIHQYTALCAPHVSQMAAIEALRSGDSETERMVAAYDVRRRYLASALNDAGLACPAPDGAFYVFPSIEATGLTSEAFAARLLDEAHVAVVPGSVFGASGEGHVRCSYAAPFPVLEQAVERIRHFTGHACGLGRRCRTAPPPAVRHADVEGRQLVRCE
ncbi:MAG: aminotransferase class I/II-fold pyridoxal phosphate-dependent enzyme [Armatimonadetes bacterium]|nr:aminotransferase class I/II-fold pyridoxal phosphate-dependent enzyme [Armatimonadota bacterium]